MLYALDGYDEISLTGATKAFSQNSERVLTPQDFGLLPLQAEDIAGGDSVDSSAEIFMNVIQNNGTQAQHDVVCANAGMAIATAFESFTHRRLRKGQRITCLWESTGGTETTSKP